MSFEALTDEAPDSLIERGLSWIKQSPPSIELARTFEARAQQREASFRAGAWRMLAGAAAAQARPPPEEKQTLEALIVRLDDLQREIDRGLDRAAALDRFAELGASILAQPVPRFFDQQVNTSGEDDTVFYWTAGAVALKRACAPQLQPRII